MLEGHDRRARPSSGPCAVLAGTLILHAVPAHALSVRDCRDAGVGSESIVPPVEKSHLALYGGKADANAIDTVERKSWITAAFTHGPSGGSKG